MNWDHPRNSGIFWDCLGSSQKKKISSQKIPIFLKTLGSFGIFWDDPKITPEKLGSSQKNWDHPKIIPEILGTFGGVGGPCDHCIFAFSKGQFSSV